MITLLLNDTRAKLESKKNKIGHSVIRTRDLMICSHPPYHLAMCPCACCRVRTCAPNVRRVSNPPH